MLINTIIERVNAFALSQNYFKCNALRLWCGEHVDIAVLAVSAYVILIMRGPQLMERRKSMNVKPFLIVWNAFLSVFSIFGAFGCASVIYQIYRNEGFRSTVCKHPQYTCLGNGSAFWLSCFCLSKIPEMIDTLFLVVQKKQLSFLHWFHHLTVMLYCWHSFTNVTSTGLWFATMNYVVHSLMYSYYFLMCFPKLRSYIARIAPLVTGMQIAQMFGGLFITLAAFGYLNFSSRPCYVTSVNVRLGLIMYLFYTYLFVDFFVNKYLRPKPKEFAATQKAFYKRD